MCLCHKVATWGIAYLIRTGACEALLCHVKPGSWLLNPSWMELPYVRVSLAARRSSASFWSSSELYCVSSGLSVGRSQPAETALWIIKKKKHSDTRGRTQYLVWLFFTVMMSIVWTWCCLPLFISSNKSPFSWLERCLQVWLQTRQAHLC